MEEVVLAGIGGVVLAVAADGVVLAVAADASLGDVLGIGGVVLAVAADGIVTGFLRLRALSLAGTVTAGVGTSAGTP